MNRRVKTTFIFSIILNIAFISLYLGQILGFISPKNMMRYKEKKIIATVSSENKKSAHEFINHLRDIRRKEFEKSDQKLNELEEIVISKDFNKQLFLKKMEEFGEIKEEVREKSDEEIAEFLDKLNQNDRKKIVEELKAYKEKRYKYWKD